MSPLPANSTEPTGRTVMRRMQPLFGTLAEISVLAPAPLADTGLRAAFAAMDTVQQQMGFHDPDSDLSRINLHAWRRPVSVNPTTYRLLCLARHMARKSDGLFDFTAGGRLVREGRLPDHGFRELGGACGWDAIELLPRLRVRLKRPLVLNLDGMARGFAVDAAVQALLAHGVTRGRVNAGGDLRLFGPEATPVAMHEASGASTPLGEWRNTAIATSSGMLAIPDRRPLPACLTSLHGCDGPACPHFNQCPRAWAVLAGEAWRAEALTLIAGVTHETERADCVARLGGRLLTPSRQRF